VTKVRKLITMLSGTIIMAAVFQGLTLQTVAPKWLVNYCYLLSSCLIFLCGLVIGQEWEEIEKGFLAMVRLICYAIILGISYTFLPVLYGVSFQTSSLTTFLLGRGIVAALLWFALGMAGVFTGAGTKRGG